MSYQKHMSFQQKRSGRLSATVLAVALGLTVTTTVFAHNVVSGVYADGMRIEGEVGFSNGSMAEAGVVVEVLNESGEKLGETVLTDDGMFVYLADTVQKYLFKANLSSGHIAEMVIEADELSDDEVVSVSSPVSDEESAKSAAELDNVETKNEVTEKTAPQNAVTIGPGISVSELQSIVRSAVAQQVRPLQKELRAYKEKVMFRDIAGGLGFIFGLFGVAAWMASKRNVKDD